jgi:ribonuclease T2
MKKFSAVLALLLLCLVAAAAQHSHYHNSQQPSQGKPGVFDYYLLTLSWSPEFCHGHPDKPECQSGHHGFVLHGLWPQYNQGYPENCSNTPGLADPSKMADIMPDAGLVAHEWSTHGTCSGLDADAYFNLLRQAYTSIKIPSQLVAPQTSLSLAPQAIKDEFKQANPSISADEMTVSCGNNYLTAVSFCMSKDLKPIACQNVRDCRGNSVRIPPIR